MLYTAEEIEYLDSKKLTVEEFIWLLSDINEDEMVDRLIAAANIEIKLNIAINYLNDDKRLPKEYNYLVKHWNGFEGVEQIKREMCY